MYRYEYVFSCVCTCTYVCVCALERIKESICVFVCIRMFLCEFKPRREKKRASVCSYVCVCVCVCVCGEREREREREREI